MYTPFSQKYSQDLKKKQKLYEWCESCRTYCNISVSYKHTISDVLRINVCIYECAYVTRRTFFYAHFRHFVWSFRKGKMMWVFFCFFSFCLRMFLFFHEMKNGEDEKEEDIMEERDGNYTYRWKPTNEEMRERRHGIKARVVLLSSQTLKLLHNRVAYVTIRIDMHFH